MINKYFRLRIFFSLGLISWILMTGLSLVIAFSEVNQIAHGIPEYIPEAIYVIFFLSIFYFFKLRLGKSRDTNLQDMLWRVFVTGLVTCIASLLAQLTESLFVSHRIGENPLVINLINSIHAGLVTVFFISTLIVWQKFIFYQKSKRLIYSWKIFEYLLLASLLYTFLNFRTLNYYSIGFNVLVLLFSIYFSGNLKWVAYLNFRQKLKSILLFLLIMIYMYYYIQLLYRHSAGQNPVIILDLFLNLTISSLFVFILIYALISILVILFNLPTSSVFEKKLEEIINFQRLSQSRNTGRNEEEVYDILIDSSVSAVLADAAWLEANEPDQKNYRRITYRISAEEIKSVKTRIQDERAKKIISTDPIKNIKTDRYLASFKDSRFRSILIFPVFVQNESIGSMVLLKEISDGFNEEMINVIRTFVNQASISIENFKLIETAIENERYIKELNIAKTVQRSLLPKDLVQSNFFDIAAFSRSADEVGGDYYDISKINDNKTIVIIGDVSGKGTSAAFQMSQLKGIFHSLVQLKLSSKDFMVYANNALSNGLDKNSFITSSIFTIDNESRTIEFSRAGHCPTLFYHKDSKRAEYYYGKGLGLGIIRNHEFENYVNIDRIDFSPDDILVLFTDGITEARNSRHEEFGYERLKKLIEDQAKHTPDEIREKIINSLYRYCESNDPEDDYTVIIIKFINKKQT